MKTTEMLERSIQIFDFDSIISVISIIVSFAAVVISILVFIFARQYDRKMATVNAWHEIRTKYYILKTADKETRLNFIKELEHLAVAVDIKIYDFRTVNQLCGAMLIKIYDEWMKEMIDERRKKSNISSAYCDVEKLIVRLKKKRHLSRG